MLWYVQKPLSQEYRQTCDQLDYATTDINFVITGDCTNGEIRLMEGESEFEGRLEVCINSRWGTVGSNGWTKIDEQVICNDLGYDLSGELHG